MKTKHFKFDNSKKDACNKTIKIFNLEKSKTGEPNLEVSQMKAHHPDDRGGTLFEVNHTASDSLVSASLSFYLNREECLELAKILTKHAKDTDYDYD